MENQIPVTPQVTVNPQIVQETPKVDVVKPRNNFLIILLSVLLFLSVSIAGFFAFQTQQLVKELNTLKKEPTNMATVEPTVELATTNDPTADWKTYTGKVRNYTIKYPSDWIVDFSTAELPINDTNSQELIISKGEYKISILWPSAYGPSICLFDDQSKEGAPIVAGNCLGKFVDIGLGMRRLSKPDENMSINRWTVYNKEKSSGYYVTVPPISYLAPSNYDENVIKIMDVIMSTYMSY